MSVSQKTAKIQSTHICINCGACCKAFTYIQVSPSEIEKIESLEVLDETFNTPRPKYSQGDSRMVEIYQRLWLF